MTDMQTSLPLLIVRLSILNPVINFSTHLWLVKWNALQIYLYLAHSIPSPLTLMQHMHQPWSTNNMFYFILLPMMHLHIFVPSFPPLSLISIKGVLLIDAKDCTRGRWLTLESCIFYGHHHKYLEWHSYRPWDHSCRIFDLDTNWWGTSPYVIAWVIH
jgi:hypothetical protein